MADNEYKLKDDVFDAALVKESEELLIKSQKSAQKL